MALSEFGLIKRFFAEGAQRVQRDDLILGIGDDCALVAPDDGHDLAITMDTLIAGIHFPPETEPYDIGYRCLAVNLSDLAAMGAKPAWFTLALTLPVSDSHWLKQFSKGLFDLAEQHKVALIGGDTTRGPLSITIQIQGYVPKGKALRRSGARPGDLIFVSGNPGESAGGLRLIQAGKQTGQTGSLQSCFLRPQPRLSLGEHLHGVASAAIDVSDGLLADVGHIAECSGLAARIDRQRVPLSQALVAGFGESEALDLALTGGDDYELCFCAPPDEAERIAMIAAQLKLPINCIGRMQIGVGANLYDDEGSVVPVSREKGYQHF